MTGTERKVFQKYYPPDYDPSKLRKEKSKLPGGRRNRQFVQRVMTPFNMQCNTCHEYIYKGKKFNMKRETVEGEQYLGLNLFRFYFRCPNCLAEITFKTDLENCDYKNEFGATRLFEAFKLHKEAERAKEAQEEKDAADPMKMLEKRTMMSRAEMEAMGDIQELQESSRHKEGVDVDRFLTNSDPGLSVVQRQKILEEEDEAYIRELYGKQLLPDGKVIKRLADEDEEVDEKPVLNDGEAEGADERKPMDWKPVFSKDAPIKRGSDQKSMLSKFVVIKKKKPEAPEPAVKEELCDAPGCSSASTSSTPKAGGLVGLADYGSSSDDE